MKTLFKLHMVMLGTILGLTLFNPAGSASPVEITNTPLPVNSVDTAAQNRFQAEAKITTDVNGTISIGTFIHPAKIVVIEFVSATCKTNSTTRIYKLGIETTAAGVTATHNFVPTLLFSDKDTNYYAISQQTRIYSDPNVTIPIRQGLYTTLPEVIDCSISISGYLSS